MLVTVPLSVWDVSSFVCSAVAPPYLSPPLLFPFFSPYFLLCRMLRLIPVPVPGGFVLATVPLAGPCPALPLFACFRTIPKKSKTSLSPPKAFFSSYCSGYCLPHS